MNDKKKVELGDEVQDTVTGFKGTVVAITYWLHQCARAAVQPKVDKDGKVPEMLTFDIPSLKILKKAAIKVDIAKDTSTEIQPRRTGGSQNDKAAQRR